MQAAIVTGADHAYFPLMHALLQTLDRTRIDPSCRLLAFDFGLLPDERAALDALVDEVVRPTWWFQVADHLRLPSNLGYAARPIIPTCFPGYDTYLWLDADISVQDCRFAHEFLHAADKGDLAIVEEADPSYRTELYALKWRIGNAFRCFGAVDGLRLSLGRQINSGAFALRADAPHWQAWQRQYQRAVMHAGRANLDQHALMATLCLDNLPVSYLGSPLNWICARSQPIWDEDRQLFCRPLPPFEPISVLHLAGRQKKGVHEIKTRSGGIKAMPLSYARPQEDAFDAEMVSAPEPNVRLRTERTVS